MTNVEQILTMVAAFPTINDSSLAEQQELEESSSTTSEVDIPALLSSIRSKYRATCASLGMRARMVASATGGGSGGEGKMSL